MADHRSSQAQRRTALELVIDLLDASQESVVAAPEARTTAGKLRMLAEVRAQQGEGVMLKRRDAGYDFDTRVDHSVKVKFRKTCECVVTERNADGSLNARLGMYDIDGKLVSVGGCSMIGKPDARPGDVVEVEYLYATEALTLYQPSLWHIRTDKVPSDCTLDQLAPVDRSLIVR